MFLGALFCLPVFVRTPTKVLDESFLYFFMWLGPDQRSKLMGKSFGYQYRM